MAKKETTEADIKLKALESLLTKNYGSNYIGVNQKKEIETEFLVTEYPSINYVLGGGVPVGKLIEIYGKPSSGKSTVSYQLIAQVQKAGKRCVLIDAENSFDINYARNLGIDPINLAIFTPDTAEQAMDLTREVAKSDVFSLIVIDSIAALSTKEDVGKTSEEFSMAVMPRLLGKTIKEICNSCAKNDCTVIAINQVRDNLSPYGQKEITPGGNALKFHASIRVKVTRKEYLKEKNEVYGILSEFKTEKNKVGLPYRARTITILFPHQDPASKKMVAGIDFVQEVINAAIEKDLIICKGGWFYYGEEKVQGMPKCREYFILNPDQLKKLKKTLSI